MKGRRLLAVGLAIGAAQAGGCGGQGASAPPAQAPSNADQSPYSGPAKSETGGEEQGEKDSTFANPPPGGGTTPPPGGGGSMPAPERAVGTVFEAQAAFERDSDSVASALSTGKDCDRACKAFGSMGRSSQRICDLNGPGDPDERCKKARERVDTARAKIRRSCGNCAE